ncbi:MAG: cyclic nucleotide-binding domain-containing protein [Candidatus Acidiferrales bacterium]
MGLFQPSYFLHAANIVLLVAYSVRDILWLRLFAVAASLIALPYFILQPEPLWEPIIWSSVFAAINSFQSWRIFVERRPVQLALEEEEIRRLAFPDLPSRKVLQILSIGAWRTLEIGERLLERGKRVDAIYVILRGKVRVKRDDLVIGELAAGQIVGSALLLSGVAADVDAAVIETVRCMRWEVEPLDRYLAANPATRIVLQKYLARDLAEKLLAVGKR